MGNPIRALLIEDSEPDAALLVLALRRGERDVMSERVDTAQAMRAALERQTWDVILCDVSMPGFDHRSALALMREEGLDLPFILVSGGMSEAAAAEAMRYGAHDFVLKDHLGPRLVAAIEREIREAGLRAERRQLADQLIVSDRMVSMGMLVAGVAHEINNPLACVMANLELAQHTLDERFEKLGLPVELGDVREELVDARAGAERIHDVIQDLRLFSRSRDDDKSGPVDVQQVLESTLRMAGSEVRHRARLVRSYGKTPPVRATESRLGQVFLNLVVNALQALPEGHARENEIRITTRARGGQVAIEIADTGSGMSPEVLRHLFTPFFTTKPVGVGTGLGLSICHRIIRDFGGSIEVESELGKGTTFRVSLPVARVELSDDAQVARPFDAQMLPLVADRIGESRAQRFPVADDVGEGPADLSASAGCARESGRRAPCRAGPSAD